MPKTLPVLIDASPLCCTPLGSTDPLSEADALALALRLKALADPVRLRLVAFILAQADLEACTCDLAPYVGLTDPTVSHHLKRLESAGILAKERRGMNVFYRVIPEAIHAISRVLDLTGG
ncbi:MAG TPA: metalloregulator ArsR/SmtB family transcription factor [Acidimicrobiales bacterium]|nr:metalloregulator ArsR/SmtB family transcription factor [Acidimicrobiales bacterium]